MKSKLPNFLLVGAAKCGTSSLHNYLNQHSDIFMPTYNKEGMKVKEPRFLIKDLVQNRLPKGVWNWDEYQALFDDVENQKCLGESTVLYLYFYEHAIKNIKKYLGVDVKIIIMLRNPIYRAYSAYSFASRTMQENQSFKNAIDSAYTRYENDKSVSPMILYKELGMYADKAGTDTCKVCPSGYYSEKDKRTSCTRCPVGRGLPNPTPNIASGHDSIDDCLQCSHVNRSYPNCSSAICQSQFSVHLFQLQVQSGTLHIFIYVYIQYYMYMFIYIGTTATGSRRANHSVVFSP